MEPAAWPVLLEFPVLGRLLLALVLGAAIGLEREFSGKPAGLRTNILICVGAELFTELSLRAATGGSGMAGAGADPSRIAAQIVSGIGFLGAGTIIVLRGTVVGLTTAATIWVVAAIGMAVGFGHPVVAVGATILVLVTLVLLAQVERLIGEQEACILRVELEEGAAGAEGLAELLSARKYGARRTGFARAAGRETTTYRVTARPEAQEELLRRLAGIPAVRSASLE